MNATFSIDELAQRSGLSTRAIRDYIARGLLPPANALGRAASYSQEHLDRLLAIRALRVRGRGLAEIDQVLASGDAGEIQALAREGHAAALAPATSPLDYINSIAPRPRPHARPDRQRQARAGGSAIATLAAHLSTLAARPTGPPVRSEEWVRAAVTPDFEISARGPLDVATRLALEGAADILRALMEPASPGGPQ